MVNASVVSTTIRYFVFAVLFSIAILSFYGTTYRSGWEGRDTSSGVHSRTMADVLRSALVSPSQGAWSRNMVYTANYTKQMREEQEREREKNGSSSKKKKSRKEEESAAPTIRHARFTSEEPFIEESSDEALVCPDKPSDPQTESHACAAWEALPHNHWIADGGQMVIRPEVTSRGGDSIVQLEFLFTTSWLNTSIALVFFNMTVRASEKTARKDYFGISYWSTPVLDPSTRSYASVRVAETVRNSNFNNYSIDTSRYHIVEQFKYDLNVSAKERNTIANRTATRRTTEPDTMAEEEEVEDVAEVGLFHAHCYWVVNASLIEEGTIVGTMWSSCGERLHFQTSTAAYADLVSRRSSFFFIAIFFVGLPLLVGTVNQNWWVTNSRGRTLFMNALQIMLLMTWQSYLFEAARVMTNVVLELSHSCHFFLDLLRVVFVLQLRLGMLLFSYEDRIPNMLRIPVFFGSYLVSQVLYAILPITVNVAIGFGCLFWVPQLVHSVLTGAWAGLTTPYLLSGTLCFVLPALVYFSDDPAVQTVTTADRVKLLGSIAWTLALAAFLTVTRLTNARNLLPPWLAPWRHNYKVSLEAVRESSEEPLCSICNNSLLEGWDDADEPWRTPCHHIFHKSCLLRWMDEQMSCPLCRSHLPPP